jgi:hypothetical protein
MSKTRPEPEITGPPGRAAARWQNNHAEHGDHDRRAGGAAVSPAAKLCGFLILLGVVFGAAHLAGTQLGPVTTQHAPATRQSQPGRQPMNMGGPAPQAVRP